MSGNNGGDSGGIVPTNPLQAAIRRKAGVRRRFSKQQIEKRRMDVWEMLCLGHPQYEIAKSLQVSPRTVERDVKWWRNHLGKTTKELKDPEVAATDVGLSAKRLEQMFEDAYVEFTATNNPTVKVRFLQTGIHAVVMRHKILADAGYLPRIGHEKEHTQKVKITFEQRFGSGSVESVFDNPQSRRRVLEAAESLLKSGMADSNIAELPCPGDDAMVVDAEVVVPEQSD